MKSQFKGYYRPSDLEISKLWKECLFTFDTNTLLHFFRYSKSTSNEFMRILKKVSDRIWLTNQAAIEYHKLMLDTTKHVDKSFEELAESAKKFGNEFKNEVQKRIKDPHKNFDELNDIIEKYVRSLTEEVSTFRKYYPTEADCEERINQLSALFEKKVGEPLKDEPTRIKEAENRFSKRVPPGYKDAAKEGVSKYGDVILWFQIIEKAKIEKKPVIFITDDRKEDWWKKNGDLTIGPRPELIQEMLEKAGVDFYMYQPSQFLKHAAVEFSESIDKNAVDEVSQVEKNTEKLSSISFGVPPNQVTGRVPELWWNDARNVAFHPAYINAQHHQLAGRFPLAAFGEASTLSAALGHPVNPINLGETGVVQFHNPDVDFGIANIHSPIQRPFSTDADNP